MTLGPRSSQKYDKNMKKYEKHMKIILNFTLWTPPVQVSGSAAENMKKI